MAGPEFFQTGMGRKFYERDVPMIAESLHRLAVSVQAIALNRDPIVKDLCGQVKALIEEMGEREYEICRTECEDILEIIERLEMPKTFQQTPRASDVNLLLDLVDSVVRDGKDCPELVYNQPALEKIIKLAKRMR